MKKIFSILLITIFLIATMLLGIKPVYADEADVEVNIEGTSEIEEGFEEVVMSLKLGKFTGVEEGKVMAIEATLDYSSEIFSSVKVVEQNGWDITYAENTKKIVGTVDEGKANTTIAQLIFTVNKDVKANTTGQITLRNFNITDDINLDKTVDAISKNITTVERTPVTSPSPNNKNESGSGSGNSEKPSGGASGTGNTKSLSDYASSATKTVTPKEGTTTASSVLPKAGLKNMIIISIIIVAMIGIGSYIRSKTIKLK